MKTYMTNKKTIVGVLTIITILAIVVVASTKNPDTIQDMTTPNAKAPPDIQSTSGQVTVPALSMGTDTVTCQQPPKGSEYGGINGNENNPPKGTTISPELTIQYGRPTAIGVCGTYWYIVGWWFNASEMAKLPSESLLYGVSPYAITTSDGSMQGSDGTDDGTGGGDGEQPVIPVPEVATVIFVAFGIFVFVAWKKVKK